VVWRRHALSLQSAGLTCGGKASGFLQAAEKPFPVVIPIPQSRERNLARRILKAARDSSSPIAEFVSSKKHLFHVSRLFPPAKSISRFLTAACPRAVATTLIGYNCSVLVSIEKCRKRQCSRLWRKLGFRPGTRTGLLPDAEPLAYGGLSPRGGVPWSSVYARLYGKEGQKGLLSPWPVPAPGNHEEASLMGRGMGKQGSWAIRIRKVVVSPRAGVYKC
jgi:hypothetical protein